VLGFSHVGYGKNIPYPEAGRKDYMYNLIRKKSDEGRRRRNIGKRYHGETFEEEPLLERYGGRKKGTSDLHKRKVLTGERKKVT